MHAVCSWLLQAQGERQKKLAMIVKTLLFLFSLVLWGSNRQDVTHALMASPPRKGSALQVLETARREKNAIVAYNVIENKIKSFAAGNYKTSTVGTASSVVNIKPSPVKAMTAVAYRETRLLKAIAVENMETTELAEFWQRAFITYPFLESHSTAWFELLDAHVLAGNMTGLLHWGELSVSRGGTLTPPLLKELLFSYAYNTTTSSTIDGIQPQQLLQGLLPILSKLCNSRTATPPSSPGTEFLWLPLPMSLLRKLAVDLLAQRRSTDALAVLSCVHPLQWPYDTLLTALATEGGASRIKACESILLQRQKLVVDMGGLRRGTSSVVGSSNMVHNNLESSTGVTTGFNNIGMSSSSSSSSSFISSVDREGGGGPIGLSPIRGSTARALLAMALQRPGTGINNHPQSPVSSDVVEGYRSENIGSGNDNDDHMNHPERIGDDRTTDHRSDFVTTMNSIRTLVAKAVAQTASNCDSTVSFRSNMARTRPSRSGLNYGRINVIHSTSEGDLADIPKYDTLYEYTQTTQFIISWYQYMILIHSLNTSGRLVYPYHC